MAHPRVHACATLAVAAGSHLASARETEELAAQPEGAADQARAAKIVEGVAIACSVSERLEQTVQNLERFDAGVREARIALEHVEAIKDPTRLSELAGNWLIKSGIKLALAKLRPLAEPWLLEHGGILWEELVPVLASRVDSVEEITRAAKDP